MCMTKRKIKRNNKKQRKLTKVIDVASKVSKHGYIKMLVTVDDKTNKLVRYSFTYVNHQLCALDNGRVLGYDNRHGKEHRHFMGKVTPFPLESLEKLMELFEQKYIAIERGETQL